MWASIDIYRRLIAIRLRAQLQYRVSFLLDLSASFLSTVTAFCTLALIFQRFQNIAGWTLWEVAFLYAMVEVAFGVMDMFFSGFDYDIFGPLMVQHGGFDQVLLRPLSTTLQVLGSDMALKRLGRIAQAIAIFGIAVASVGLRWTLGKALYLPVVLISLVAFFGGLFIIGATTTFWTVQRVEALNIFTYGGSEMMAYPMHIYAQWMRRFFTYIVPAIFLNYYPALYFLDKPDPLGMPYFVRFLSPVAGFGVLAAALAFWQFGVRHYASTGT